MNYQIITTVAELESVCAAARNCDTVMLDTEFVRTRTFYPQLGLIQLFDGERLSLIDPLAIEDMSSFKVLLKDKSVLKVLHACGEDLEVFEHSFSCVPQPMLDTQLMAAFLGHGLSTGFATLVKHYLAVELDKSESRTDWCARPLTDKQLDYAAADVFYLLPLFQALQADVEQAGWSQAAEQESRLLVAKRLTTVQPDLAYKEVKGAWLLNPEQLAILKVVAKWRLLEAKKRDLAVNFVVKENDLLELCRQKMTSLKQMDLAGFDQREIRRHGQTMLALVGQGKVLAQDKWPAKIIRLMDDPSYKQLFKKLKDEVKLVSQTSGLATEFLASKKQINQVITWVWRHDCSQDKLPDVMRDWRKPLLGEQLHAIITANEMQ